MPTSFFIKRNGKSENKYADADRKNSFIWILEKPCFIYTTPCDKLKKNACAHFLFSF